MQAETESFRTLRPDTDNTGVGSMNNTVSRFSGAVLFFWRNVPMNESMSKTRILVECAVMLALATALSMIKLVDLPYGGSVTIACMLPVVIISYRCGIRYGLLTGLAMGIIQQLLGLNTLSYVSTWQSVLAVILLDYIIAFTVIGLGGIFRKIMKNQAAAILFGSLLIGILRYICHVISGCTVWAGLSIPTGAAFTYSLIYNATYMIPETLVVMIVGYYLASVLDFRNPTIRFIKSEKKAESPWIFRALAGLSAAGALVFDVAKVFAKLQNSESGEFDITGIHNVNWKLLLIVTAVAVVLAIAFLIIGKSGKKPSDKN